MRARVLTHDPATGVLRHVDVGYPEAETTAKRLRVRVPMAEQLRDVPDAKGATMPGAL